MANPSDYQTYLDYINNRNSDTWREFWFYNYITDFRQNNRLFSVTKKPYSDYSWIAQSGYYNFTNIGGLRTPPMFASDILDVYISSNGNDLYSYSVSGTSLNNVLTDNSGSFWDIIGLNDNGTVNENGNNAGQSYSYSLSNTSLESVLSHISRYFKNVNIYVDGEYWSGPTPPIQTITSNGGGATHIAKVTGQLSSLSNNLSDILMVSGGGGGGLIIGEDTYAGKEAGGISGSGDNSADQNTGNAFGQGESGTDVSGGGSGLYGGYKGTSSKSGGAGSGYIGNSLVSNKKMVGYNVPTSSAESTKTESVNEASESPVSGKPKIGNGYAKIKLIKEAVQKTIEELAKNTDFNSHCKNSSISLVGLAMPDALSDLSQYYGTDWNLRAHGNTSSWMTYSNNVFKNANDVTHPRTCLVIPLKNVYHVKKVTMKAKIGVKTTGYDGIEFWLGYSDGSTITFYDPSSYFMVAKKPVSNGADTNHKLFEIPGDSTDFNAVTWEYDSLIKNVNYVYIYLADTYIEMKDLTLFLSEA